jgi:anaerobic magnesium-protoporphyrin IX monomethyl ester cyclase
MIEKIKVLLIGSEDEENLAIRYLGSVLIKNNFEVKLAACSRIEHFKNVLKIIKKFNPDLIGISLSFQTLADMYFDLIKQIRKIGYKNHITVGGHFPTFEFKKILETQIGIDSVVRFEGEIPIIELANSLKNKDFKNVHNLVYRENNRIIENECILKFQNLDEIPFPLRDKTPKFMVGERFATILSSRGCYHSACLYCCIAAFHNKKIGCKFALRSIDNVSKEISYLYHRLNVRVFQFHDDNFMLSSKKENLNRIKNLKAALINEKIELNKIAFIIKARPDSIDEEIASELKGLGVTGIFLGIENASNSGLKNLIRLNSLEDIYNSLDALRKTDIVPTYNLLIFYPDATIHEIDQNIKFIEKNLDIRFDIARAEAVVGSPLEKLLINRKQLIDLWPNSSYICKDKKVEKMFDLYVKLFRSKSSLYTDLTHIGISLSYHIAILKKLHPGNISDEYFNRGKNLIKAINELSIKYIKIIRELVEKDFTNEELIKIDQNFKKECKDCLNNTNNLIDKMYRLQITETNFEKLNVKEVVQENKLLRKIFKY